MDSVNEGLRLASELETIKLVLFAVIVVTIFLGGAVIVILRGWTSTRQQLIQRDMARAKTDDDIRKAKAELEAKIREAKLEQESSNQEWQSQREDAQLEVIKQAMGVLQDLNRQLKVAQDTSVTQVSSIAERNRIQAEQTKALQATTQAVEALPEQMVAKFKPVAEDVAAGMRKDLIKDAVDVVESVKAQAAGSLAIIEGIPQRLAQHEQHIDALLKDAPDEISRTVGERLAADLRQISEHLLRLSTQIETVVAQTRPKGEAVNALES
jgi:hypothetical protein